MVLNQKGIPFARQRGVVRLVLESYPLLVFLQDCWFNFFEASISSKFYVMSFL